MNLERVFQYTFASIYPLYIQKVEKKGRKVEELDALICWLTGYNQQEVQEQIQKKSDLKSFFDEAPKIHPNVSKITGMICGQRVEEIENPLMQKIRYMDKMVDELAKGKSLDKILRK